MHIEYKGIIHNVARIDGEVILPLEIFHILGLSDLLHLLYLLISVLIFLQDDLDSFIGSKLVFGFIFPSEWVLLEPLLVVFIESSWMGEPVIDEILCSLPPLLGLLLFLLIWVFIELDLIILLLVLII